MIDIKELAEKHGAKASMINKECLVIKPDELQAFADEYIALSSSEPVAYGYANSAITGANHKLMMVKLDNSSDQYPELALPLYLANPLNQQLLTERNECVEEIKRLNNNLQSILKLAKLVEDYNIQTICNEALTNQPASIQKILEDK